MPIVRESPHARISPSKNAAQWPPRSPLQALLSSPSGRKRYRDVNNQSARIIGNERDVSPSPSPRKAKLLQRSLFDEGGDKALEKDMDVDLPGEIGLEDDEDEDEEILQLQLQQLQTKLKLKQLERKKLQKLLQDSANETTSTSRQISPVRPRLQPVNRERPIEVPMSPVRSAAHLQQQQTSPARVRLGMPAVGTERQVSLKRARDGTQLPAHSRSSAREEVAMKAMGLSFSERLAQNRSEALKTKEVDERLDRGRSKGFHLAAVKSEGGTDFKGGARDNAPASQRQSATRRSATRAESRPSDTRSRPHDLSDDGEPSLDSFSPPADGESQQSTSYDPISSLHLSKRHIPHATVTRETQGKTVYNLPQLLKAVKSPHYDLPTDENNESSDIVIFAILASKSSPYNTKTRHRTSDESAPQEDATAPRNKFMVLHLTDLKWEVDCFLFGSAFDQFWKLTPGTLLAILNPGILPPKSGQQDTGKFALKLGSCEDCVMEIGVARDLAWCDAKRADGKQCEAWVDKRKTGVCAFHLELGVQREGRRGRMEVNGMWRSHENGDKRSGGLRGRGGGAAGAAKNGAAGGKSFHREYGQLYSLPPGLGLGTSSAAGMLDAEDRPSLDADAHEASRKRIVAKQKERDLARQLLGKKGKGVGAEYLQHSSSISKSKSKSKSSTAAGLSSASDAHSDHPGAFAEKPSAAALGLMANTAASTHLSPAKDRKSHFGLGPSTLSKTSKDAMGWGGARKVNLGLPAARPEKKSEELGTGQSQLRMRVERDDGGLESPVRGGSRSPVKKKARFALEQGIREAGKESLGVNCARGRSWVGVGADLDEDDEDGLEIV